jgi:hypothetical protein
VQQGPNSFVEASKMPVKTTLSANIVQPNPSNYRFLNSLSAYVSVYNTNDANLHNIDSPPIPYCSNWQV